MRKLVWLVASIWLACGQAARADAFKNVKCDADIPKALIGQRASNDRVVVTEGKYRSLGLKHLGADQASDELSSINWLICGKEFIMLQDRNGLVRDVIGFPPHSKKSPAYTGNCKLNGKELPDIFEAVLNAQVAGDELPALSAWKIDLQAGKFIKAPTAGLRCPRNGVYTVDGGG
jgi:hypothetical protein